MEFPNSELELVRLAQDVAKGLAANPDAFPAPPGSVADINQALAEYDAAREAAVTASATAQRGTALKHKALDRLADLVRANVKYAESMALGDDSKLQLLAWGPRRTARTPTDAAPGQVITLSVVREGKTWVTLGWKAPFDGGPVAAYRIQRRTLGAEWSDVGTAVETELTLNGQESGIEFEYQVLALNKSGHGPASNIVRAVL